MIDFSRENVVKMQLIWKIRTEKYAQGIHFTLALWQIAPFLLEGPTAHYGGARWNVKL